MKKNTYIAVALVSALQLSCSKDEESFSYLAAPTNGELTEIGSDVCEEGLKAFKETVYNHVRKDCTQCHDPMSSNPKHGPGFAGDNPVYSYAYISSLMDFTDVAKSRFIKKGGNLHCRDNGGTCTTTAKELKPLVDTWWANGEKNCSPKGKFASRPFALDENLPVQKGSTNQKFIRIKRKIEFSQMLGEDFEFSMDAQIFVPDDNASKKYYRFFKPRILSEGNFFAVKGLRILVNGIFYTGTETWTTVDAKIPSRESTIEPAILTTLALIVPSAKSSFVSNDDFLSISFEKVEELDAPYCHNFATFEKEVLPLWTQRSCTSCHSPSAGLHNPKLKAVNDALNMEDSAQNLCIKASMRINTAVPLRSILHKVAGLTQMNHPMIYGDDKETKTILKWIEGK